MHKQTKYENELIAAIKKHKWMRWAHIDWDALSFSKATAYNHNLERLETIKETFEHNRSKGVNYLLQKWIASDNATLQIAAMRLMVNEDDHRRLNQNYTELTGKDGAPIEQKIDISILPKEILRKLLKKDVD